MAQRKAAWLEVSGPERSCDFSPPTKKPSYAVEGNDHVCRSRVSGRVGVKFVSQHFSPPQKKDWAPKMKGPEQTVEYGLRAQCSFATLCYQERGKERDRAKKQHYAVVSAKSSLQICSKQWWSPQPGCRKVGLRLLAIGWLKPNVQGMAPRLNPDQPNRCLADIPQP